MSKWFKLGLVLSLILVVLPVAGCLKGPGGVTQAEFKDLLTLVDIQKLSTPSDIQLESVFDNLKPGTDPSQTLHVNSYYRMVFVADDQASGVALTMVDFDSAQETQQNLRDIQMNLQMQPMATPIGTTSMEMELNQQGATGSLVVFQHGNTIVELFTGVPDGTTPILTLANLETLARQIAAKM